jgi:hypothetical protein
MREQQLAKGSDRIGELGGQRGGLGGCKKVVIASKLLVGGVQGRNGFRGPWLAGKEVTVESGGVYGQNQVEGDGSSGWVTVVRQRATGEAGAVESSGW